MSISPDPGGLSRSPLEYPANSVIPLRTFLFRRDPINIQDFKNFRLRDFWINLTNDSVYVLTNKNSSSGTWTQLSLGGASGIITLTGDSGGAVGSDGAGNLDVLGGTGITTSGNPGINTITIDASTSVATQYDADAGSAIPAANILNILGGTGIATSGAGNTITISNTGGAFDWQEDTTTGPFTVGAGEGRIANAAGGQITYNLPAACAQGDTFQIAGLDANGYTLVAGGGQTVIFGNGATSAGGTITPQVGEETGSTLEVLCVIANTTFFVLDSLANFDLT